MTASFSRLLEPGGLEQSEPGLSDLSLVSVFCQGLPASLRVRQRLMTCQLPKTSDISTHLEPGVREGWETGSAGSECGGREDQFLLSLTLVHKCERLTKVIYKRFPLAMMVVQAKGLYRVRV